MTRSRVAIELMLDLIWPRVSRPLAVSPAEAKWPTSVRLNGETIESAYTMLRQEYDAETDRIRTVETKLLGVSSLAPVAMAIIVASLTALTTRNLQAFTRVSVFVVGVVGGYVSLQFLRAIQAAIAGLSRRSFFAISLKDLYPLANETKEDYLTRNCLELADVIRCNRAEIDAKVTCLALAHTAIRNAVFGLLFLVLVIVWLAVWQTSP